MDVDTTWVILALLETARVKDILMRLVAPPCRREVVVKSTYRLRLFPDGYIVHFDNPQRVIEVRGNPSFGNAWMKGASKAVCLRPKLAESLMVTQQLEKKTVT